MMFLSRVAPVAFLSLLATAFGVNAATIKRADVCNGHAEVSPQFSLFSVACRRRWSPTEAPDTHSQIPIVMHQDVRSSSVRWSSQFVRSRRHFMYVRCSFSLAILPPANNTRAVSANQEYGGEFDPIDLYRALS